MKRLLVGVLVGVAVLEFLAVVILALRPTSVSEQTPQSPFCTMPTDVKYSPGTIAPHDGQYYECVHVFGENVEPAGVAWVAWVEMARSGDGSVPKEPDGR